MKSGIYKITNTVNGKVYVGSAVNVKTRWYRHRRHLRLGTHYNPYLQNAWNKYGADAFVMCVLEHCSASDLIEKEVFYIGEAKSDDRVNGYNVMTPADGRLTHSTATRQKLRVARLKQGVIPHAPAKMFEHKGQLKSAKEWAAYFGVNYTTFRQKLSNGLSVAEASQTKPKKRLVEFNGESLPLKEVARRSGINYGTLWSRCQRGLSVEAALNKKSLKQMASEIGLNYQTLMSRLYRGISLSQALSLTKAYCAPVQ